MITGDTSKEGDDGGRIRDDGFRKQKTNSKQEKWSKTSLKRTMHNASSFKEWKIEWCEQTSRMKERGGRR